ncbi:putative GNAT family acetyltransferase [Stipitochalara longipes BDJ]|nr:putative GNAT family acetyltransferase [Stipitochalara longipes BDJ]
MSGIEILPATLEDFPQLAQLNYHGFSGTPVNSLMFGGQSEEEQLANTEQYLKKALDDPTCKLTKAVMHGQIVAFAQWHYYLEPMAVEDGLPSDWGAGANGPLCDAFFGSMKKVRKEQMGGKRCAVLAILVTAPDFQGRGVGSLLCNDGLRIADQENLPAWLEASAKGRKLYQKLGFEDVVDIVTDLSKYGGEGVNTTVCMMRKIRSS